jgi:ATP-dependent RNA helicase DeaD
MSKLAISSVLQSLGINALNPMQEESLQAIASNNQTILLAPTGSGKTLAFLLPIYLQLKSSEKNNIASVVIIAPTRELALQIQQVWRNMQTGLKSVAVYGGHKIDTEINELIETPSLIIGTPGRLRDHINRQSFAADTITTCVIDEFDKTLELGFQDELQDIISTLPNIAKTILVSATELDNIPDFMNMENAATIHKISEAQNLQTKIFYITSPEKDKLDTLEKLLKCEIQGTAIVFVNHRESAERIFNHLALQHIDSIFYHGGMEQLERELAIIKFKNHTADILIASDIASRGLDIDAIGNIIHFHLPDSKESFIHRNGRTARQQATGNIYLIKHAEEDLPDFIDDDVTAYFIKNMPDNNWESEWLTLTVNAGKKNKINKIDIVGFLSKVAHLHKHEIGLINVLDTVSFVAVPKNIYKDILANVRNQKIKGKNYIFRVAK